MTDSLSSRLNTWSNALFTNGSAPTTSSPTGNSPGPLVIGRSANGHAQDGAMGQSILDASHDSIPPSNHTAPRTPVRALASDSILQKTPSPLNTTLRSSYSSGGRTGSRLPSTPQAVRDMDLQQAKVERQLRIAIKMQLDQEIETNQALLANIEKLQLARAEGDYQVQRCVAVYDQAKGQVEQLGDRLLSYKRRAEQDQHTISQLQQQKSQLHHEVEVLAQRSEDAELERARLATLLDQQASVDQAYGVIRRDADKLAEELAEAHRTESSLREELDSTQRMLQATLNDAQTREKEHRQLLSDLSLVKAQNKHAIEESSQLTTQLAEATRSQAEQADVASTLRARVAELEARLAGDGERKGAIDARHTITKLQRRDSELKIEIGRSQVAREIAEQQVEELTKQLQLLESEHAASRRLLEIQDSVKSSEMEALQVALDEERAAHASAKRMVAQLEARLNEREGFIRSYTYGAQMGTQSQQSITTTSSPGVPPSAKDAEIERLQSEIDTMKRRQATDDSFFGKVAVMKANTTRASADQFISRSGSSPSGVLTHERYGSSPANLNGSTSSPQHGGLLGGDVELGNSHTTQSSDGSDDPAISPRVLLGAPPEL